MSLKFWSILFLGIAAFLGTIVVPLVQMKLDSLSEEQSKLDESILDTVISGLFYNDLMVEQPFLFHELQHLEILSTLKSIKYEAVKKEIQRKIIKNQTEIIDNYNSISQSMDDNKLKNSIDTIVNNKELSFEDKYQQLVKIKYSLEGNIQKNIFDPKYKKKKELEKNESKYKWLRLIVLAVLSFSLVVGIILDLLVITQKKNDVSKTPGEWNETKNEDVIDIPMPKGHQPSKTSRHIICPIAPCL